MGRLTLIKNQVGYVDPQVDFTDSGWVVSGGYAQHYACNPGTLNYIGNFPQLSLVSGASYNVTYTIDQFVTGIVYPVLGTSNGASRATNGTFTDTLVWNGSNNLQFYSDGQLRISVLQIAPAIASSDNGQTIAFSEKFKMWNTYYSFEPEFMLRYSDSFFTFKNGQLWEHNTNTLYNNFYGVQYSSVLTFYINIDSQLVKNYHNIKQIASAAWGSVNQGDIFVLPHEGKPNGQQSRLKPGNYKNYQGDYFADFLRDMSDPRFSDVVTALFGGAELQGHIMEITLENAGTGLARLVSVDVTTSPQGYTYGTGQ